ncbi:unnamed protein product [Adineta steineri]|uniref:Uncharacterized protein n=2 Tax=Adineta steineri TaxID=433720 RepID=A0A815PL07_9BILA|nr:unnamed protein product [Adineta steineri]
MLPVETDEKLYHSWSYYRYSYQSESGYRTIEWDLTKPATLIATNVKYFDEVNDESKPCYIDKIVYIECPNTN